MTRINGKCNRCKCVIRSLFENNGSYYYDLDNQQYLISKIMMVYVMYV